MAGLRVLIVEDDLSTRAALRSTFSRRGWQVTTAATLGEGLASLDPAPDCIVLDLVLPDGPGEAVLRKVRAENIPSRIAVSTGTSDPTRLAAVKGMEPDILLFKPLDSDVLFRVCQSEVAGA